MNDADKQKLKIAFAAITNLETQLTNLQGRGARAAKTWQLESGRMTDLALKKGCKDWSAGLAKLVKDAKVVQKDLATLWDETRDAKTLAKFATAKEFRDKLATKRLMSARAFEPTGIRLVHTVEQSMGGGGLFPGASDVDIKVCITSLTEFSRYYNALRIDLAKL